MCRVFIRQLTCRDERSAITYYYNQGFSYKTIIRFLAAYHGIDISLRTLKRRLQDYNLCRSNVSSVGVIDAAIETELQGPGTLHYIHCVIQEVCGFSVKKKVKLPSYVTFELLSQCKQL